VHEARDAEVDDLDRVVPLADRQEHDVVGLDVEVDDALLVRRAERLRDLAQDGQRARPFDAGRLAQHAAERLPVEVLHDEEDPSVGELAEVRDVTDVGAAGLGGRPRLAAELLQRLGVARDVGPQQLERDLLLEVDVLREVHRAHATLADLREDAVARAGDDLAAAEVDGRGHGAVGARTRARLHARQRDDLPGGWRGPSLGVVALRDRRELGAIDDAVTAARAHEVAQGRQRARPLEGAQDRAQGGTHLVGVGRARRGVGREGALDEARERRRHGPGRRGRRRRHAGRRERLRNGRAGGRRARGAHEQAEERAQQVRVGRAPRRGPGLPAPRRRDPVADGQGGDRGAIVEQLHLPVGRQQHGARREAHGQR
jgi:hypothetical protein